MGRQIESIPSHVMDALVRYQWPGNVRELENVIERAVILSPGPDLLVNLSELAAGPQSSGIQRPTAISLQDAEREHILAVLRQTNWVLGGPNGAAARLAIKRTTLQSRMKKLGIARPT
jgi:formate hydrogenlyase transcriptional activator